MSNAFPHEKIERKIFMQLPRGPFPWNQPGAPPEVALLIQNLYGTPPAPRTFTDGLHSHHCAGGFRSSVVERTCYSREDEHDNSVIVACYVDEGFGGASCMDIALWYKAHLEKKYKITWRWRWGQALGFGVEAEEGKPLAFTSNKYILQLVDQHLAGETKPNRNSASRQSIMKLSAVELPEIGSPEDVAMQGMQELARSLNGGLGHLSRGRPDITFDHAIIAQGTGRPSH